MNDCYRDATVRRRLIEFLGGDSLERASAVYLTHSDGCAFDRRELRPPQELDWFLQRNLDIARSLADSESLLLHLDVEYVNFDSAAEAYMDPWRAFDLQDPVVSAIESVLLGWGIEPLHIITGQGHHFIWRIARDTALARRISALGPAPELLHQHSERMPPIVQGRIDAESQNAFGGLGLLMEFLAHRVKSEAVPHCELPVEITAVHVGPGRTRRREIVSIDISEYGDPLHTRMVRMPFTYYLKPWLTGLARSLGIEGELSRVRVIPLHEMDVRVALKVRQVEGEVRELAKRACVRIPEQAAGTERLLAEYLNSRLRRFHEFYYSTRHDPPERWPLTYHQAPLGHLPPCVRNVVERPNDWLLKPAGMQLITRCLLADGWHPRHIAGFIRSRLEDPAFGWGTRWDDYDAALRADFYVRIFAGLYETGLDRLVDFNCTSTQEKGFCCPHSEGCSLEPFQTNLLTRQCA